MRVRPMKEFNRAVTPPPDKSITIRALVLGMLARGKTYIRGALFSEDTLAALNAVAMLGAEVSVDGGNIVVSGGDIESATVDCRNSATAARLLAGAVAGKNATVTICGDKSLSSRKMNALIRAISDMGGEISSKNGFLPLTVKGKKLHGIDFVPLEPSAQVKSAVLLAGLDAEGETTVTETIPTRTHTEDMLASFGADIRNEGGKIVLRPSKLIATEVDVPGDMSSAAYPIVLGLMRGYCFVRGVGAARRELIDFLRSIGGEISVSGDVKLDIEVKRSELKPFVIEGALATALIDELPLLAVLACFLGGDSVIRDAAALRNKECDRIACTAKNIRALGGKVEELKEGLLIHGCGLNGGEANSFGDHRMAMSMAVGLALSSHGGTVDDECTQISYPEFGELLI